ncbi:MAG: MBL fold metallo-hydrolase [Spirochaetota bacterium]|nr:MBL fold metallo-hydrolase [Spirochaetota bacterium]
MSQLIIGQAVQLTMRIRRVLANNAGIMPGTGTNTYLIGEENIAVIDPGPDDEGHIRSILNAVGDRIRWILVTHTHPDHSPGAHLLKTETGAEVMGGRPPKEGIIDPNYKPDRVLDHDSCIHGDNFTLKAICTPGHASNHLCFLLMEERVIFTGDHIMNGSTVVIAPPDGDMQAYLDSLALLKRYSAERLAPGHGEMMDDPDSVIDGLIKHRLQREGKVINSLRHLEKGTIESLTPLAYDDVPSFLHPVARFSLWAHLLKLEREHRASKSGDIWSLIE